MRTVRQVAKLVGIDPQTLFRWVWAGKVKPSVLIPMGARKLYLFTDADVEKLRRYKAVHYWEGRGGQRKK